MVWLDPIDSARPRLGGIAGRPNQTRTFEWGETSTPAAGQPPATHLGPLPQPAGWARLEVPADALGSASAAVKLRGMTLEVDHGQIFFDRPGYLVRKVTLASTKPIARRWMRHRPSSAAKVGPLVGAGSCRRRHAADLAILQLAGTGQRRSRAFGSIAVTQDQAPSIVIEKPAADVVLPAVQPLPISARAIDDWGIEAVGMQSRSVRNRPGPGSLDGRITSWPRPGSLTWLSIPRPSIWPPANRSGISWWPRIARGRSAEARRTSCRSPTRSRRAHRDGQAPESLEPLRKLSSNA